MWDYVQANYWSMFRLQEMNYNKRLPFDWTWGTATAGPPSRWCPITLGIRCSRVPQSNISWCWIGMNGTFPWTAHSSDYQTSGFQWYCVSNKDVGHYWIEAKDNTKLQLLMRLCSGVVLFSAELPKLRPSAVSQVRNTHSKVCFFPKLEVEKFTSFQLSEMQR